MAKNKKNKTKKQPAGNAKPSKSRTKRSGITPSMTGARDVPMQITWGQDSCTVVGKDFINTMQFADAEANRNIPGAVIMMQMLNPWRIVGSRLTQFANLFQRFAFLMATIKYIPAVPATTAGQIIVCFDTDPTYAPLGSSQGVIRSMMAHKNRKFFHVFDEVSAVCPKSLKSEYYCDVQGQDIRLNNQAVFWAAIVSPVVNGMGEKWIQPVGSFVLEWKVMFRTARIALPQKTTFYDCVEWAVDPNTGFGDLPYNLVYLSGAKPTTQAGVVIIRTFDDTINGIERGVVYYYGVCLRDVGGSVTCEMVSLYGTLRGAQQLDANDVIPIDVAATPANMSACFYPLGPESGARGNVLAQRDVTSGTTNALPVGTQVVDLKLADRRFQGGSYYINYTGTSAEEDVDQDPNGSFLIYEDNDGVTRTVYENQQLILKPKVPVAKVKSILGLNDAEINNIWGAGSSEKMFLGILTTVLGYVVRSISVLTTLARIGFAIKREFDMTDERFLQKIQFNDFFTFARAGVHPGHTLGLVANLSPENKLEEAKRAYTKK